MFIRYQIGAARRLVRGPAGPAAAVGPSRIRGHVRRVSRAPPSTSTSPVRGGGPVEKYNSRLLTVYLEHASSPLHVHLPRRTKWWPPRCPDGLDAVFRRKSLRRASGRGSGVAQPPLPVDAPVRVSRPAVKIRSITYFSRDVGCAHGAPAVRAARRHQGDFNCRFAVRRDGDGPRARPPRPRTPARTYGGRAPPTRGTLPAAIAPCLPEIAHEIIT